MKIKSTYFLQVDKIKIKGALKKDAGTRIRTRVTAGTTQCPNH